MKKTVSFYDFVESFSDTYKDNFSREGKLALFNYLEEYEESTDTEIELDSVALCCEYTEFDNLAEYNDVYFNRKAKSISDIEEQTQVILIPDTERFIIADY